MNPDNHKSCPVCNITWVGEPIPADIRDQYEKATDYFITNVVGIEYQGTPEDYDGVSEYRCLGCETRWGAWTGKVLGEGELEPRGGRR